MLLEPVCHGDAQYNCLPPADWQPTCLWAVIDPFHVTPPGLYTGHEVLRYWIPLWLVCIRCPVSAPSWFLVPSSPAEHKRLKSPRSSTCYLALCKQILLKIKNEIYVSINAGPGKKKCHHYNLFYLKSSPIHKMRNFKKLLLNETSRISWTVTSTSDKIWRHDEMRKDHTLKVQNFWNLNRQAHLKIYNSLYIIIIRKMTFQMHERWSQFLSVSLIENVISKVFTTPNLPKHIPELNPSFEQNNRK